MDSADSTEKTIYFLAPHCDWNEMMILIFVILGILGPLTLLLGVSLLRLRQPHAVQVLAVGFGLTLALVVGAVSMLLGL
jgi:hypothetical protein